MLRERQRGGERRVLGFALTVVALGALSGCSTATQPPLVEYRKIEVTERVPGTVFEDWVEPMFDTVHVPGQIDPAGNYYRMPHQTVVEIRPGRFEQVEYQREK